MHRLRIAVSEAVAVALLSIILIIAVFVANTMGMKSLARLHSQQTQSIDVDLTEIEFNPDSCSLNISLRIGKPTDVRCIHILLENNATLLDCPYRTITGRYSISIGACSKPIAIIIETQSYEMKVLKLG